MSNRNRQPQPFPTEWHDASYEQQQQEDEEQRRRQERQQQERWQRAVSPLIPDLERLQQNNDPSWTTWTCRIPKDEFKLGAIAFYNTLGRALQHNTHLDTLVLHHFVTWNETLSSDPFIRGIVQSKVQHLTFKCDIPTTTTATTTATAMTELYSEKDDFARLVSHILEQSRTLTMLELVHATLGDTGMALLAQAIHRNTTLTSLKMEGCDVGARGLGILFDQGLRDNTSLTKLHMERCNTIDDDAVQSLVEYWQPESPLETLALRGNCIESTGAHLLVQAARQHPSLRALDLSYNRDIDYDGLRLIGNDLPHHRHLTRIGLFGCATINVPISLAPEEGQSVADMFEAQLQQQRSRARRLAKDRRKLAEPALLEGLKRNLYLNDINVMGNELCARTENEMYFYIHRNRMGGYLLLSGNDHDDDYLPTGAWCHILAQCQTRMKYQFGTSLAYFYLRENPMLTLQARNRSNE